MYSMVESYSDMGQIAQDVSIFSVTLFPSLDDIKLSNLMDFLCVGIGGMCWRSKWTNDEDPKSWSDDPVTIERDLDNQGKNDLKWIKKDYWKLSEEMQMVFVWKFEDDEILILNFVIWFGWTIAGKSDVNFEWKEREREGKDVFRFGLLFPDWKWSQ